MSNDKPASKIFMMDTRTGMPAVYIPPSQDLPPRGDSGPDPVLAAKAAELTARFRAAGVNAEPGLSGSVLIYASNLEAELFLQALGNAEPRGDPAPGAHTSTACPACGKWHDPAAAEEMNRRAAAADPDGDAALLTVARDWIKDSFGDVDVTDLTDIEVRNGIARHYDGGWAAFAQDAASNWGASPDPRS